jgi:hypothetical protein
VAWGKEKKYCSNWWCGQHLQRNKATAGRELGTASRVSWWATWAGDSWRAPAGRASSRARRSLNLQLPAITASCRARSHRPCSPSRATVVEGASGSGWAKGLTGRGAMGTDEKMVVEERARPNPSGAHRILAGRRAGGRRSLGAGLGRHTGGHRSPTSEQGGAPSRELIWSVREREREREVDSGQGKESRRGETNRFRCNRCGNCGWIIKNSLFRSVLRDFRVIEEVL